MALGDNGLLKQAQLAKDMATNSTIAESENMNQLLQEYMNLMAEDGEVEIPDTPEPEVDTTGPTVTIIESGVTENSIAISVEANDPESGIASENAYVYYLNGVEQIRKSSSSHTFSGLTAETSYTIKVEVYNGVGLKGEDSITISTSAKPGISADDIQQNPAIYYGAEVTGYSTGHSETSGAVSTWRIFYADESNIYLIADNYIAAQYAPKGKGGSELYANRTYMGSFEYLIADYLGASDIGASNPARKWIDTFLNSNGTSTNNNMKAVAYMLDTNVWSIYAGSQAEYAIGGPTLEMFCASYKDTHPSRYLECDSVTSDGYQIKWSDDSYGYYLSGLSTNEYNFIYIKPDLSLASGMWLASPSANRNDILLCAKNDGYVSTSNYMTALLGLRPLVCLKSSVQLEQVDSDTFRIV